MKVSWILIIIYVFLMMFEETLNQQIRPQNTVQERSKRYHESDRNCIARVKQGKTEREKRNVPPESVESKYVGRKNPLNLSLGNKTPANTCMPLREIVRIKPLHRITKNRAGTTLHKPVISVQNQEKQNNKESTINQTPDVNVEEKDKIVDTSTIDKPISTNVVQNIEENKEKSLESKHFSNIKCDHPLIKEPKIESESKTKDLKPKKINDEETHIKSSEVKQDSEEDINTCKPIIKQPTKLDTLLENERSEIKDEEVNQPDKKLKADGLFERDSIEKSIKNDAVPQDVIVEPRKHPFLDAIQNDLYINCPINSKPADDKVIESRIKNNVKAQTPAFDLNSIHDIPLKTENNDENEGIIIKNQNYEEIMELTRTPNVLKSWNWNTAQDNLAPSSYNNYNQVSYGNYQIPKAKSDLNNGYQYNNDLNAPRIDEKDSATVVSYNNYYKMPTAYAYPNYNNNLLNNNQNYGFIPPKPNQCVGSNVWNNNRVFNKPIQANEDTKDKIWRSWKNTEYYLKSRNALQQLSNENFYNFVNQNSRTDRNNYIQRRNVLDINGNYIR